MSLPDHSLARPWAARHARTLEMAVPGLLLVLAALSLLHASPALLQTPGVEAGAFLTTGEQVLRGAVPYRDVWVTSPPLMFLINALGLALGGPGRWGVWLLETASVGAAALMLYAFLRRFFGAFPALFAAVALLGNLIYIFDDGNLPETYGLALQAGMLLLGANAIARTGSRRVFFSLGLLAGLALSLRLTLLGTAVAVVLCLLAAFAWSRSWRRLLAPVWLVPGLGAVVLAWAVWLGTQGALPDLWDQVFRYGLRYSNVTNPERLEALAKVFTGLWAQSGFFALGLVTWLVVFPFLFANDARLRWVVSARHAGWTFLAVGALIALNSLWDDRAGELLTFTALSRYRLVMLAAGLAVCAVSALFFTGWIRRLTEKLIPDPSSDESSPLLLPLGIALVDLPLELVLSSLAGQDQVYRFIPMLPSLTILVAFLAWSVIQAAGLKIERFGAAAWLVVLALPVLLSGWWTTLAAVQPREVEHVSQAAGYVRDHVPPGDPILQWGSDSRLYFLSRTAPASRYGIQQALFTPGYTSPERIREFLSDLQERPPSLIVDTRPENAPLLVDGQPDCARFAEDDFLYGVLWSEHTERFPQAVADPLPFVLSEMKHVYRWVCENYTLAWPENPGPDDWRIYQRLPDLE